MSHNQAKFVIIYHKSTNHLEKFIGKDISRFKKFLLDYYQSLPELRSSERVVLELWPWQTVLQVPKMKENAEGGPSLSKLLRG